MIGLSATLLMAVHGRVAGLAGILTGVLPPFAKDWTWRVAFLAGAALMPFALVASNYSVAFASPTPTPLLIIGGIIVGFGVKLGSGCTSGHGICGIARLSPRSIAATGIFMAATAVTVFIIRHVI